jgi:hypothetical protein
MVMLLLLPFFLQGILIGFDEFYFHWRRGLPRWERIGHPLDTLSVLLCFLFLLVVPYSPFFLKIYIGLALFSCIFVTKDEFVHKECCPATEQWLHAVLFLNHPVLLTIGGIFWYSLQQSAHAPFAWFHPFLRTFLWGQVATMVLFAAYQIIYWNLLWKKANP